MSPKASLEVTAAGQAPRTVVLENGTTTIGRSSACTIVLDNPLVSRNHAELQSDGAGVRVSDLGPASGEWS